MSLTYAELLRRRAAETKGGDHLLSEAADALDRLQRLIDSASRSAGVAAISEERHRQITAEGWTAEHDDAHQDDQLVMAAVSYLEYSPELCGPEPPATWPWDAEWWKPSANHIRNCEKAGALIAAEIDRRLRREA